MYLVFFQTFQYDISHNFFQEKTLEITVWDYDRGCSNDFIGGVRLGRNAKGDRRQMWEDVARNPEKPFSGWFILAADLSEID